jgi:hypothetical protein
VRGLPRSGISVKYRGNVPLTDFIKDASTFRFHRPTLLTDLDMAAVHRTNGVIVADNERLAHIINEDTIKSGAKADAAEHTMSLWDAFRIHKKAIFWSMALSGALIMEGYDVVVIGSYYGQRKSFYQEKSYISNLIPSSL